jgi:hypothetical protein
MAKVKATATEPAPLSPGLEPGERPHTVNTAARELLVSPQTVRNYVDNGKLRAIRTTDGQRIFPPAEVERCRRELIAERKRGNRGAA